MNDSTIRALQHIAAHRTRPSVRLLDAIYGPQARVLRTAVASIMLDRKVTGSDKEAQFGRLRRALLAAVGASGDCTATEDADFDTKAEAMLAEVQS